MTGNSRNAANHRSKTDDDLLASAHPWGESRTARCVGIAPASREAHRVFRGVDSMFMHPVGAVSHGSDALVLP